MNINTAYPIDRVRRQFPSLQRSYKGKPVVYFDSPGGTQFVAGAIKAINDYMTQGAANLRRMYPTSRETGALLDKARDDIKMLFNADDASVAFGQNATSLMFHTSRALARQWEEGDEILLSELEHHSNIDAWKTAAEDKKVTVKYIPLDTKTLTLNLDMLPDLITEKTKFCAVGMASNSIGTITDIKAISLQVKKAGAIFAVDAVHAVPHLYVDMQDLGIDMMFSSAYKFFSTHVGMAIIKNELFENLDVYKVAPAPDCIPDRLEMGTQNHEGIPAISASVQFIASLGIGTTMREQIISGYKAIEDYENVLAEKMRHEMMSISGITLYQAADNVPKTPTFGFRAEGIENLDFCTRMCEEHSVFIESGDFYNMTLANKLGIRESGSLIRAGLAPYNTLEEVERFLNGVRAIMSSR